jgi:hypothetical protein
MTPSINISMSKLYNVNEGNNDKEFQRDLAKNIVERKTINSRILNKVSEDLITKFDAEGKDDINLGICRVELISMQFF